MSKYAALTHYLEALPHREVRLTFGDIERLLKMKLPKSARNHRAWWSNNGDNSVMTRAWLDAGWRSERVDMAGEALVFSRVGVTEPAQTAGVQTSDTSKPRIIGRLRGTVTIVGDLMQATGETWHAEQGVL